MKLLPETLQTQLERLLSSVQHETGKTYMPMIAGLRAGLAELPDAVAADRPYMDDGEAQDSSAIPCIDYLRDSVEEIRRKRQERGIRALAALQQTKACNQCQTPNSCGVLIPLNSGRGIFGTTKTRASALGLNPFEFRAGYFRKPMTQIHEWPGEWTHVAPQVADHPPGAELVWAVRGEPFTRTVLARTNVGARVTGFAAKAEKFVYVELMAEGFRGVHAGRYGFFDELEWRGPLVLPNAELCGGTSATNAQLDKDKT